jgi:hypothetical protein
VRQAVPRLVAEDVAEPAADVVRSVVDEVLRAEAAEAEPFLRFGGDGAAAGRAGDGGDGRGTSLTVAAARLLVAVGVNPVDLGAGAKAVVGRDSSGGCRGRGGWLRRRRGAERNRGARNPRVRTRARGLSIRILPAAVAGADVLSNNFKFSCLDMC